MAIGTTSGAKRKAEDDTKQDRPNKFKSEFKETLTILVGQAEEHFIVHKDVICASSEFFDKACSGSWLEARHKTIKMPDQRAENVKLYLDWLHAVSPGIGLKSTIVRSLLQSWMLGDYINDTSFKSAVMDNLMAAGKQGYGAFNGDIKEVFEKTAAGCVLQRYLTDRASEKLGLSKIGTICSVAGVGELFILELLRAFVRKRDGLEPKVSEQESLCKYHEHHKGEPRCKT